MMSIMIMIENPFQMLIYLYSYVSCGHNSSHFKLVFEFHAIVEDHHRRQISMTEKIRKKIVPNLLFI